MGGLTGSPDWPHAGPDNWIHRDGRRSEHRPGLNRIDSLPRSPPGSSKAPCRIISRPAAHTRCRAGLKPPGAARKRNDQAHAFANSSYLDHRTGRVHATPAPSADRREPALLRHQWVPQLPRAGSGRPRGRLHHLRVPPPAQLTDRARQRTGPRNRVARDAAMTDHRGQPQPHR